MPTPTLVTATERNAQSVLDGTTRDYVVSGYVDNMDLSDTPDVEALLKVEDVAGWPAPSSPLSVSWPNLLLTRTIVVPSRVIRKRANFQWHYQTLRGVSPTKLLIRDRSYVEQMSAQMIPGTWDEYRVAWANPDHDADQVEDIGTLAVTMALRAISITAMKQGTISGGNLVLNDSSQDYINYVNSDESWPATLRNPKGPGFWKFVEYDSEEDVFANYNVITATVVTRSLYNWADFIRLQRPGVNQWLPIDHTELVAKANLAYAQGVEQGNGFIRVCNYPTTSFSAIFPI